MRMPNFAAARRTMVDGQVRTSDVTDLRLVAAMLDLPRERFVPQDKVDVAYLDLDIPVGGPSDRAGAAARRLLKPMVLAKLLQAADIGEADRVLDVGCATGYSTALLGRLAGAVIGLEEDTSLAQIAGKTLTAIGATNVTIATGPLTAGWPTGGPYDVIILEGATEVVPAGLSGQLKDGGRLLCVLGRGPAGKAVLFRSQDSEFSGRPIFDAAAAVLPGFTKAPQFVF
jgi:protein-L-isoaspartate(D-aspartate) O-methyltransferase